MTCSRMAESWRRSERVSAKKVENLVLRLLRSATALQSTQAAAHRPSTEYCSLAECGWQWVQH